MATLGMTVLFGLIYFMAVLHIFGPERQEGNLALPCFHIRSTRVSPASLEVGGDREQELALQNSLV